MAGLTEYPVDEWGNLMSWVAPHGYYRPVAWVPNEPQRLTLTVAHFMRGRSSTRFHFTDENNRGWDMFMKDFQHVLTYRVISYGVVKGTWIVVKRGANYGLAPYEE